jgi:hypothetical protein
VLFGAASVFTWFWVATRYLLEFMPPLIMLAIMGFLQGHSSLARRKTSRILFTALAILLIAISIAASILLGMSSSALDWAGSTPPL